MKNINKILIVVFALVLVAVTAVIIFVKSDNKHNASVQVESSTVYTPEGVITDSQQESVINHSQQSGNENYNNNTLQNATTLPDKQNSSVLTDKTNNNNTQASKTYDLSNAEIIQSQRSSFGDIKLISAKDNGMNIYLIEATVEDNKFYYEIPGSYNIENIYYANLDGYYGDELIIHANTGYSDIYENVVLKITKNGIQSLITKDQMIDFTSAYSSILKDDFNVEIINTLTGTKKTVNVKNLNNEDYSDSYWEKDGSIAEAEVRDHVWFEESCYSFEPRDVDDDGLYEIVCSQKVSLGSLDSTIGRVETILKFNFKTKEFEVTKSEFYPKSK